MGLESQRVPVQVVIDGHTDWVFYMSGSAFVNENNSASLPATIRWARITDYLSSTNGAPFPVNGTGARPLPTDRFHRRAVGQLGGPQRSGTTARRRTASFSCDHEAPSLGGADRGLRRGGSGVAAEEQFGAPSHPHR